MMYSVYVASEKARVDGLIMVVLRCIKKVTELMEWDSEWL